MIKIYEAELKGEMDSSTVITGDFNIPLSTMDRATRLETSKEIEGLNNTILQLDPTDVYRALYPSTAYTFFPSARGTFSRTDHMLGHTLNFNRF